MTIVLEVRDLAKSFGGVRAVNGVSFDVREGEILGLIGPNGSGKSTLFNCILGQLAPTRGEVMIESRLVHDPSLPVSVGVGEAAPPGVDADCVGPGRGVTGGASHAAAQGPASL